MNEIRFAKIISYVFNPLVILVFGFFIATYESVIKFDPIGYVSLMILMGTLPTYFYVLELFKNSENRTKYGIPLERTGRYSIYLSAVFSSLLTVIVMTTFGLNPFWIQNAMLIGVLFGVVYFVNRFIDKVSLHTTVFSFFVVYIANAVSLYWLVAFVLLPLIANSRIVLHKHTKFQLALGAALGMFIALISWTFV